jgi:hypothetical protein
MGHGNRSPAEMIPTARCAPRSCPVGIGQPIGAFSRCDSQASVLPMAPAHIAAISVNLLTQKEFDQDAWKNEGAELVSVLFLTLK